MHSQTNNLRRRHAKRLRVNFGMYACVFFLNCSSTPPPTITCADVQAVELDPVFNDIMARGRPTGCAEVHCHVGTENPMFGNVDEFYFATVGKKSPKTGQTYIAPNDLKSSLVFQKVLGSDRPPRMPLGGPYLNDSQLRALAGWICQGAPPPKRDGG